MPLLIIQAVLFQHHGQPQPEHFQAEYVPVPVSLHIGQICVIEVFTVITRDDAGIPHKHPVGLREHFQIAAKIKRRVSIALNAECLVGVLLRLEQCARGHRVAEFLHKLAHDDGQLACNFIPELRVAFLRGNLLREMNNHPATGDAAAAVGEAHRVIVHGQNHRRNMR